MATTRTALKSALDCSYLKLLSDELNRKPTIYDKVFKVNSSSKAEEKIGQVNSFGLLAEKKEGTPIEYDSLTDGYTSNAVHTTYALGFRVTEETIDDEQFAVAKKGQEKLVRSGLITTETIAGAPYNNAFNSAYPICDGKELCATNHTSTYGVTGRNELSTPADLSATALKQAITDLESTTDSRGKIVNLQANILMVPTALQWKASELIKSTLSPETNYNAVNSIQTKGLQIVINPYLTDSDAWFLLDTAQYEMLFFWRKHLTHSTTEHFDTSDLLVKVSQRCSTVAGDWRGVFGTPGA